MAQDTTAKKSRGTNKSRKTIQLVVLLVVLVCIAMILLELYTNVTLYLAG